MKFKKSIFSFFLVVTLCFGLLLPTNASQSTNIPSSTSYSINEYDMFASLSEKSDSTLRSMGYSTSEINEINNFNEVFTEHVLTLNTYDTETLIECGYSDEQIYTIRNFSGSEADLRSVSATVSITATTTGFSYDGDYTRGKLAYTFTWNGVPAFKSFDVIAASWNDWAIESKSLYLTYYNIDTGSYSYSSSATFISNNVGTEGGGYRFRLASSDNYDYAKTGSGFYNLRSDVHAAKDFYYYIAYGHSQIIVSAPSFSVSVDGFSLSLSFTTGTVTAAYKRGQYLL